MTLLLKGKSKKGFTHFICASNDFNGKAALNDNACDIVEYKSPVAIRNTENIEDVFLLTRKFFANVEDRITYIEVYKSLKRSSITQEFLKEKI